MIYAYYWYNGDTTKCFSDEQNNCIVFKFVSEEVGSNDVSTLACITIWDFHNNYTWELILLWKFVTICLFSFASEQEWSVNFVGTKYVFTNITLRVGEIVETNNV